MQGGLRVLLIAESTAGVEALRILAGTGQQVVAVVTGATAAVGASVAGVAGRLGYPLWPARRTQEGGFAELIRQEQVDLLLNVQTPYVLPAAVVEAPRIGSFNLHPGPLPHYAGLNAPSWAIFQGEQAHGVTLHWMDQGIDSGPIAYQAGLSIDQDDTGLTLSAKCVRAGLPLVHDLLAAACLGSIPRQPQFSRARRYHGREVPHQGRLIWSEPAARVVNFVRACDYSPFPSPWGSPRAFLNGREVVVLKAGLTGEATDAPAGTIGARIGRDVLVAARDEWIRLSQVQVGSFTLSAADALREGERFALPHSSDLSPAVRQAPIPR
jgi:methionyl-tRNA formyltransferase